MHEHIHSVLNAANTQTCLNDDLRESMRIVALLASNAVKASTEETIKASFEISNAQCATRIKTLRLARELTQSQLAILCGWSQSRIANYENASREPSFCDINIMAKALGVTPGHLLFG